MSIKDEDVLEADTDFGKEEVSQSKRAVFSSGLARLWGLMDKGNVGFITAFRGYRSLEENIALNDELKGRIRSADFGYVPVIGEYEEEGDDQPEVERSFAISRPGLTQEELIANLVELEGSNPKYDQRTFLVVSKGVAYYVAGSAHSSPTGTVLGSATKFRTSLLDEWMEDDSGKKYRGKTTLVRGPKNRSFTWSCGQLYDGFKLEPAIVKPVIMSYLKSAKDRVFMVNRRESIKSSYLTHKIDGLDAFQNLRHMGLVYGNAHDLMEHWREGSDEVMSSTGPHTLAEWKLYEKAKKMCDGGFSYKDALGILSRESGIPYGKVRNIVGTAEEWRVGYFDFGLEPLIHEET